MRGAQRRDGRPAGPLDVNPLLGVGLALVALIGGGLLLGWQGVIFAMTGIVFWLLLQMSRLMRVMKQAGAAPIGSVANAVMFHAKHARRHEARGPAGLGWQPSLAQAGRRGQNATPGKTPRATASSCAWRRASSSSGD